MTQPSLFPDISQSPQPDPKAEAIAQVRANASAEWCEAAMQAVRKCCERYGEFTTDEVCYEMILSHAPTTHERRAMGAVMTDAAKAGLCVKAGRYRNSERRECHSRPLAVWVSRIRGE